MADEITKWRSLYNELQKRYNEPKSYPGFVLYFFFVIVAIGLVCVILTIFIENEVVKEHKVPFSNKHIILAIASTFIALLASSSVDLILSSKTKTEDKHGHLKKSLTMVGVSSIILGLILMAISLWAADVCILGYIIAISGLLFSYYIWWITNSENPNFTDPIDNALTVIGNSPLRPYSDSNLELPGDLTGVKS